MLLNNWIFEVFAGGGGVIISQLAAEAALCLDLVRT